MSDCSKYLAEVANSVNRNLSSFFDKKRREIKKTRMKPQRRFSSPLSAIQCEEARDCTQLRCEYCTTGLAEVTIGANANSNGISGVFQ